MSAPVTPEKEARRRHTGGYAVCLLIVFVDMVGFGIIIPFLPFWAEKFGAGPAIVALVMSIYSGCSFLSSFPLGWLSDKWGRKPVLLLSIAGSAVGFAVLAVAHSLWLVFLARALGGVFGGNIAVAQAYIADTTDDAGRAKGMGLMGAAFGLGFVFGPAIGGLLAGPDPMNPNFRLTFWVAFAISMFAALLGLFLLREPERHEDIGASLSPLERFKVLVAAVRMPGVSVPILVGFVVVFAMAGLEATYALWTNRTHGWGPKENGYFFAFIGVVLVLVQGGLVGKTSNRIGDRRMLILGIAILMIGMVLVPASLTMPILVFSGAAVAIGYGFANPAMSTLTSRNAPADKQGAIMGAFQSVQSLARVIGPIVAGILFDELGPNAPYFFGAGVLLFSMILIFALYDRLAAPGTQRSAL